MAGSAGNFFDGLADPFRDEPGRPHDIEFGRAYRMPRQAPPADAVRRLRRIDRLAWVLDRSIPLGRWRIGLDPILGLVPGAGDWIGALLSVYLLYEGARLGVPGAVLVRMAGNILLETVLGAIPILGDLFDFVWKANARNMALIQRHYRPHLQPRSLRWVGTAIVVFSVLVICLFAFLAYLFLRGVLTLFGVEHIFG